MKNAYDLLDLLQAKLSFDANFEVEGDVLRMDWRGRSVWFYQPPNGSMECIENMPPRFQKEIETIYLQWLGDN